VNRGFAAEVRNAMKRLDESLTETLATLGLTATARAALAVARWPDVVGPATAAHSVAVGVDGGTLLVVTDHAGWAQQLALLQRQILARYRSVVGRDVVTALRFRVDPALVRRRARLPATEPPCPEEAEAEADRSRSDVAMLVARVRRDRERARRARATGAAVCTRCGALQPSKARPRRLCPACRREGAARGA